MTPLGNLANADPKLARRLILRVTELCQGRMATVAVNEFIFKHPVKVGDILSFFSRVQRIGNTSISVKVEVFAERFSSQGEYMKVTEATLTYVAIDETGKPRVIPKD